MKKNLVPKCSNQRSQYGRGVSAVLLQDFFLCFGLSVVLKVIR
jgi:hypothetical protein